MIQLLLRFVDQLQEILQLVAPQQGWVPMVDGGEHRNRTVRTDNNSSLGNGSLGSGSGSAHRMSAPNRSCVIW